MDTVEKANGDAAERRSAYAKASVFVEASTYAKATTAALCARTDKTADKSADKYDPPSRLRASAFAEPTAATSSCPSSYTYCNMCRSVCSWGKQSPVYA